MIAEAQLLQSIVKPIESRQFIGAMPAMARMGMEFVPGAGEYLDFKETLQAGQQAEQKLMQGNITGALGDYLNAFVSSVGVIPAVGAAAEVAHQISRIPFDELIQKASKHIDPSFDDMVRMAMNQEGGITMKKKNLTTGKTPKPEGGIKSYDVKTNDDFENLIDVIDAEKPTSIGLRAIHKNEVGLRKLKSSKLSFEDQPQKEWRELSGTSVVKGIGDWSTASRNEVIEGLEKAYKRVADYDEGYGIAIVKGSPNIDEVVADANEAVFLDAKIIGYLDSYKTTNILTEGDLRRLNAPKIIKGEKLSPKEQITYNKLKTELRTLSVGEPGFVEKVAEFARLTEKQEDKIIPKPTRPPLEGGGYK